MTFQRFDDSFWLMNLIEITLTVSLKKSNDLSSWVVYVTVKQPPIRRSAGHGTPWLCRLILEMGRCGMMQRCSPTAGQSWFHQPLTWIHPATIMHNSDDAIGSPSSADICTSSQRLYAISTTASDFCEIWHRCLASLLTFERSRSKFKVIYFVHDLPTTAMTIRKQLDTVIVAVAAFGFELNDAVFL